MPTLRNSVLPIDLQYEIKRLGLTQRALAKHFNVTDGAISGAINNDPLLKSLRIRLIQHLNSLQENKINSLKTTNNREVA